MYKVVKTGDTILVSCRITGGYPAPIFTWKRFDEKSFTQRSIIAFSQNKEIMYLQIENVQYEDFGWYECVATNLVGNVSKAILINSKFN
jgi:hypothetical protein